MTLVSLIRSDDAETEGWCFGGDCGLSWFLGLRVTRLHCGGFFSFLFFFFLCPSYEGHWPRTSDYSLCLSPVAPGGRLHCSVEACRPSIIVL